MFRVCSHQLKISLCSPRIYIAVFAGIVIQIVSLISFLDFSKTIGKPLCVVRQSQPPALPGAKESLWRGEE